MSNASKNTPATSSTPAAASAASPAKPTVTAGDVKVSVGNGAPTPASGTTQDEGDETDKIQYFVIVGEVQTFLDVREAEKFLNSPDAPQCTVIHGKITLVNEWHITTGAVHPFKSLVKAQKFLKDSPTLKIFTLVRGRITVPEVRVSLRN